MKKFELPAWLKITAALLPILGTVYAVGSWVNVKVMDDVFISEAEAGEVHEAILQKIEDSGKDRKMGDIKNQLEVINVEINWIAALRERTTYHEERLLVLRTQQRILLEQYAAMQ